MELFNLAPMLSTLLHLDEPMARRLIAFALRLTGGNVPLAEELIQEAIVRLWTRREQLLGPRRRKHAWRWFACVVRRLWSNELRRWRVRDSHLERLSIHQPECGRPDRELEDAEVLGRFRALVDRLPDSLRELVRLRYWDQLSIGQLSAQTARPGGTIKRWLHEARCTLRKDLEGPPKSDS